jgi:hypothetical protein
MGVLSTFSKLGGVLFISPTGREERDEGDIFFDSLTWGGVSRFYFFFLVSSSSTTTK